jgi:hypothetical protein
MFKHVLTGEEHFMVTMNMGDCLEILVIACLCVHVLSRTGDFKLHKTDRYGFTLENRCCAMSYFRLCSTIHGGQIQKCRLS